MFFKESAEVSSSVFGSDRKYWSQKMKTALGLMGVEGFPFQLSPLKTETALPIPAVEFTEPAPSIAKIFSWNIIYATPDEFFTTKFRDIFQQTRLKHTTSAEAKTWLRAPNMKYWPQQLSFAVFCVTQGCGISREIFDSDFSLTPQIRAFYQFHVYFTIRRVLYQLGGIIIVIGFVVDSMIKFWIMKTKLAATFGHCNIFFKLIFQLKIYFCFSNNVCPR